jgi:anti-sigma factor RsiW
MIDDKSPVTEEELHAYIDGEVPADRRIAVETWLASHPEDAVRVAAWRAHAEAIRARYGAIAEQPVPDRFRLERIGQITRGSRRWVGIAAAAAVSAFLIGGTAGWMARGASAAAPSPLESFASDALAAHNLYVAEVRHPIEVTAGESHLIPWLSRRIGTSVRAPDFSAFGLKLLGGRLLPAPASPAALFMYEGSSGERYTIYCARSTAPQTALRYTVTGETAAFQWVESQYGYVVSGPANRERLQQIAQSAYDQMENRTPTPTRSSAYQLLSRRGS